MKPLLKNTTIKRSFFYLYSETFIKEYDNKMIPILVIFETFIKEYDNKKVFILFILLLKNTTIKRSFFYLYSETFIKEYDNKKIFLLFIQ